MTKEFLKLFLKYGFPIIELIGFIINPFRKTLLTLDCLIWITNNISNITIGNIILTIIIVGPIIGLIIIPFLKKCFF